MANQFIFQNNAVTTLAVAAAAGDTSITVTNGALFPSPGAGQQFAITFLDPVTGAINEIAYCTSRTGNVLTVVRARENTTALDWSPGSWVSNFITRDALAQFVQFGTAGNTTYWPGTGTDTITVTPAPAYPAYFTGMTIDLGVANSNTGAATLNVNGLGAKAIRDQNGVALTATQLLAGRVQRLIYTGTYFQMATVAPVASFIHTLPASATLAPADRISVSQSGLATQTDIQGLAAFAVSDQNADIFFYGMF